MSYDEQDKRGAGAGGKFSSAMESLVATSNDDEAATDVDDESVEGPESPAAAIAGIRAELDRLESLVS